MKKRSEGGSRAIRKRIARAVQRQASQAGCADWRAWVPSHWDGRVHRQHVATRLRVALQFALQTAEHPEGARPAFLLLSATAVVCS